MIYLDNAATTMNKPEAVVDAMIRAVRTMASPGRGSSPATLGAEEVLFDLRREAEGLFGCPMEQVVLTTSATHGAQRRGAASLRPGGRDPCGVLSAV